MSELQEISYAKIDNTPKFSIDPNKLNKNANVLIRNMADAHNFSKLGLCTPQSIDADLKGLMSSLNSVDAGATTQMPQKINDPTGTALTEKSKIQQAISLGDKTPDQMKDAMNNIGKMFSSLPQGIQNFFKGLLGLFGIDIGNTENSKKSEEELKKLKNEEEQKKILKSYGVEVDTPIKGTNMLKFLPKSTVSCIKTPIPTDPIDTKIQPEIIKNALNQNGELPINYDQANSLDVKETKTGLIITVNNKNGSIFTYTVISEKKPIETQNKLS